MWTNNIVIKIKEKTISRIIIEDLMVPELFQLILWRHAIPEYLYTTWHSDSIQSKINKNKIK